MKFGGTSVGSAEGINRIHNILLKKLKNENKKKIVNDLKKSNESNEFIKSKIILVLSAFSGVTNILEEIIEDFKNYKDIINKYENNVESNFNLLITTKLNIIYEIHTYLINNLHELYITNTSKLKLNDNKTKNTFNIKEIFNLEFDKLNNLIKIIFIHKEINDNHFDLILSFGELFSSKIIYNYLKLNDININIINSFDIYNFKKDKYGNLEFNFIKNNTKKIILKEFNKYDIIITQGFIANNYENNIVTLGRGGSDLSASILANLFDADILEIWTDVSGIFTSDPRKINNTTTIKDIDFEIVKSMAYFGAKVLHPETLMPTIEKNINVKILNTFDEGKIYTNIHKNFIDNSQNQKIISIVFNQNTLFVVSNYSLELNILFVKKIKNEFIYLIEGKYLDILKLNIENNNLLNSNSSNTENKFISNVVKIELGKTIYLIGVNNNNFNFITEQIIKLKSEFQFDLLCFDYDSILQTIIIIVYKIEDTQFEMLVQTMHNNLVYNN